jgi:acetyltransferase-like isoleucine patch superfamily enzyme
MNQHINNNSRPLILLGSNSNLFKILEACEDHGISVHGIIDSDYFGNTESMCGVPIIDAQSCFDDQARCDYYKSNFNFICVTNWNPEKNPVDIRNRKKRTELINYIEKYQLNTISIIDKSSAVSRHAVIGHNVFIDSLCSVAPESVIEDHCFIGSMSGISHHVHIHKNCVVQGDCRVLTHCVLHSDTYFGIGVRALKPGSVFGENTFIHEMVYIRRGTIPNEIVSFAGENLSRVCRVSE